MYKFCKSNNSYSRRLEPPKSPDYGPQKSNESDDSYEKRRFQLLGEYPKKAKGVDMENKILAQDQEYMHKFRERMLKKIRIMMDSSGEMDQASNLWLGRAQNYVEPGD